MTQTNIQRAFDPCKKFLPNWMSNFVRSLFTAIGTPVRFSVKSGHFQSSFKKCAVTSKGAPIPWYTYPCTDFLRQRSYEGKSILEFGGGQSTIWWAHRAKNIVTFDGDQDWYDRIKGNMPANVDLHLVSMDSPDRCVLEVNKLLDAGNYGKFDVIIIDGLFRFQMIDIARKAMANSGAIICDDADGYGFYEGFKDSGLNRVDFFGYAPGVILPHCSSIFFGNGSFLFDPHHPIPVIAHE